MIRLSNNLDLPELPAWQARSFWLTLLSAGAIVLNALGIDLWQITAGMGLGATPDEVAASGGRAVAAWQMLAPMALGIWAWIERRAPRYRLVWTGIRPRFDIVGAVAIGLLALLLSAPVSAQGAQCQPAADMIAGLASAYGERPVVGALGPNGAPILFFAAPDGGWTMVMERDGIACMVAVGTAWTALAVGEDA